MDICLMSDIEYDMVLGRIENSVYSNGKLGNTEIGCEMASAFTNLINKEGADLITKLFNFFIGHPLQVIGAVYPVK